MKYLEKLAIFLSLAIIIGLIIVIVTPNDKMYQIQKKPQKNITQINDSVLQCYESKSELTVFAVQEHELQYNSNGFIIHKSSCKECFKIQIQEIEDNRVIGNREHLK